MNFQTFCSSTGVLHQFTCPHTSQQNGVAERKHRHIVDMGLTLMSQASLPLTLWPYAFSTSVFLINRLPSPHQGFISPWERCLVPYLHILHSVASVVLVIHYFVHTLNTSFFPSLFNVCFLGTHPMPKAFYALIQFYLYFLFLVMLSLMRLCILFTISPPHLHFIKYQLTLNPPVLLG
jgi:hypothetical protein